MQLNSYLKITGLISKNAPVLKNSIFVFAVSGIVYGISAFLLNIWFYFSSPQLGIINFLFLALFILSVAVPFYPVANFWWLRLLLNIGLVLLLTTISDRLLDATLYLSEPILSVTWIVIDFMVHGLGVSIFLPAIWICHDRRQKRFGWPLPYFLTAGLLLLAHAYMNIIQFVIDVFSSKYPDLWFGQYEVVVGLVESVLGAILVMICLLPLSIILADWKLNRDVISP
ncbi:hypothetical protein [Calycomorphotria hydatis]|uniref:Uncharacterized protein n=1 Tax=Calycomorphotria hydatis TaxID=2528027 RepID=A0A517TF37_9PLAN|nr:hypothetical protein [Calycomorphotria hydatis]QDT66985.1 hypothetical protein V22_42570 [Calycomorphotria hydatis]